MQSVMCLPGLRDPPWTPTWTMEHFGFQSECSAIQHWGGESTWTENKNVTWVKIQTLVMSVLSIRCSSPALNVDYFCPALQGCGASPLTNYCNSWCPWSRKDIALVKFLGSVLRMILKRASLKWKISCYIMNVPLFQSLRPQVTHH